MLHLTPLSAQSIKLASMIREDVLNEKNWLYGSFPREKSASSDDALEIYTEAFFKLCEQLNSDDPKLRHLTKERLRFIEATVVSRFAYVELHPARHAHDWQGLLQDTLLASRSKAVYAGDLSAHLRKEEIIRLPLVSRASVTSVGRFLRDELARGHLCCGSIDGRERWWAPSVASIVDWWISRLAWFCIRMAVMGFEKPELLEWDRKYWAHDLGMAPEIFEYATRQTWEVTMPAARAHENHDSGIDNIFNFSTRKR